MRGRTIPEDGTDRSVLWDAPTERREGSDMRNSLMIVVVAVCCLAFGTAAHADTAFIDFDSGVGPLNYKVGGTGMLTTSSDRAYFTGQNTTVIGQGGSPVSCGGTNTVKMTIQPSADAGTGVGIILINANDTDEYVTALVSSDGIVTLMDWIGNYRNVQFDHPAAGNNFLTVTDDRSMDRTTLNINDSATPAHTVQLDVSLNGASSVYVGVASNGTGGFADFTAIGPNVPEYPVPDTDGDGVSNDDETANGTDPNDPGNLTVFNSTGAEIAGLDGATLSIPPGSLPTSSLNVALSTPESVPGGSVPGSRYSSGVARDLAPDGTNFSPAVTASVPYTDADIEYIDEDTLQAFWFDGANYSSSGISSVSVDTENNRATFDTTHFTIFVLAGDPLDTDGDSVPDLTDLFPRNPRGATDSDSDGIGDEWEDEWFGNNNDSIEPGDLTTANAISDFDSDDCPDSTEFRGGSDPTDPQSLVPVATALGLVVISIGIAGTALYARRKSL